MGTYKLDKLDGVTVGFLGTVTNFTDVIDDLVKIDPRLGVDSITDLFEYITDDAGNIDEDKAKELCMDNLDGEDIDDEDAEARWGDQMYCRQAGK